MKTASSIARRSSGNCMAEARLDTATRQEHASTTRLGMAENRIKPGRGEKGHLRKSGQVEKSRGGRRVRRGGDATHTIRGLPTCVIRPRTKTTSRNRTTTRCFGINELAGFSASTLYGRRKPLSS